MAVKRDKGKSEYSFDIPEDFVEKFDNAEIHKTIRDNKKIYALTTFGRAVPYYKDGLIEAYRRALFDMVDQRIRFNSKSVKSALIVGHIIGRFHPHGDAAAYQSIVTLTQPWTNNYPLVYGGDSNFGNVLGKPAAHYRYTECKTSEFFDDVCEEIKEEYVDFMPNFDNTTNEVCYIPFKLPVLLINGSYGIADSYMTSILPHNLNDVIDLCEKYISNPQIPNEVLVDGFYPDCPNYGIILNRDEIERCYKLGTQANVKMKATMEVNREENKIIIKDLPYNMTEADVISTLKSYNEKGHAVLSKVLNIIDMKTSRDGQMFIEYEVVFDKNANILEVARDLERYCLSKTIPISMINFDGKYVNRVSIKNIIANWYDTLYTTKHRKLGYQASLLVNEIHILEGKLKIYDHIDEIVEYAKKSTSDKMFMDHLSKKYGLTLIQSKAIIHMRIQQLSSTSKNEIISQIEEDKRKISDLDEKTLHIDDEIVADLEKLRKKYGRPRRTVVTCETDNSTNTITSIPMSNGEVLWTNNQYAIFDLNAVLNGKSLINGVKTCKVNGRNIKEIIGSHNVHKDLIGIIVFNRDGTAKRINVSDMVGINNWISVSDEPTIVGVIPFHSEDDKFICITDNNKIKISSVSDFNSKQAIKAGVMKSVKLLDKNKDSCFILCESGRYHYIKISDIPELGRTASGVILNIPENEDVSIIQMEQYSDDVGLASICDPEGYSYVIKVEQEFLEETNRANKAKKLINLDGDYKFMNICELNVKDKDAKCVLIGKNSTSQINMSNIRSSDLARIPKKVPISLVGLVTYKL